MFDTYEFEHPTANLAAVLDGRSFLRACAFGPIYVLYRGFPLLALKMSMLMIPISAAIAVVGFLGFGALDWVLGSNLLGVLVLVVAALAMLVAQGIVAIRLVRWGYRHSRREEAR